MTEEKKPEEKKAPEEKKLSPLTERLKSAYLSLEKDPVKAIESIKEFDDIRQKEYIAGFQRAYKEPDPMNVHGQLYETFRAIKGHVSYFIGKEIYGPKFMDLPAEKQLSVFTQLGSQEFEDILNPVGTGGQRRRR